MDYNWHLIKKENLSKEAGPDKKLSICCAKKMDDCGYSMVDVIAASILGQAPYVLIVSFLEEDRL